MYTLYTHTVRSYTLYAHTHCTHSVHYAHTVPLYTNTHTLYTECSSHYEAGDGQ